MYSRYTTLQRAQLAKQEYLDTQDVFLAVYAPGRRASLEASLRDQLHRKFLLAEDLSSGSLGSARGVLLAKEDLSLMPTALSCFADALRSGADSSPVTPSSAMQVPLPSITAPALRPAPAAPSSPGSCCCAVWPRPVTPGTPPSC